MHARRQLCTKALAKKHFLGATHIASFFFATQMKCHRVPVHHPETANLLLI